MFFCAFQVLADVSVKAEAANIVKTAVQKQKDSSQAIKDTIEKEKLVAEAMLLEAKPLLENAENALKVYIADFSNAFVERALCVFKGHQLRVTDV